MRVFEREVQTLFPIFRRAVEEDDWRLVVSEGIILELFNGLAKGANRDTILEGLDLVESLQPIWLPIAGLDIKELSRTFLRFQRNEPFDQFEPFVRWPDFLAAIAGSRDIRVVIDLAHAGIAQAFDTLYRTGRMTRNDNYWQTQLDAGSAWYRDNIRGQDRNIAFRQNFVETVIHTCRTLSDDEIALQRFAETLWGLPFVCPGFRLNFEATASPLGDHQYAWTTNRFYDQRHLIAIPYVDKYVGLDRGQRHLVEEFDRRNANGIIVGYGNRCYRTIEEALGN